MKDGTSGFAEMNEETSVKDGTSGVAGNAEEDNGIEAKDHESIPSNEKEVTTKEAEPVKTHTKENHDTHSNAEPSKTHESTPSNEKEVTTKEAEPVKAPTEENNDTPSNAEPSKTLIQSRREN